MANSLVTTTTVRPSPDHWGSSTHSLTHSILCHCVQCSAALAQVYRRKYKLTYGPRTQCQKAANQRFCVVVVYER